MTTSAFTNVYAALLRLLPAGFRARYGAEMQQTFDDEWRDSSVIQRVRLTVRSFAGVIWSAILIRVLPEHADLRALARPATPRGGWAGIAVDARAAARGLARRPGFTFTAVTTVGLGMAAAVAVFAVIDAAVFRGLSIRNADRVIWVSGAFERYPGQEFRLSAAEFTDIANDMRSFEAVGGWSPGSIVLDPREDRPARTLNVAFTTGDIYRVTGARTVLGRLPGPDDMRLGAPSVAVISHGFWVSQFGGDSSVVTSGDLTVGGQRVAIVGVLATGVALPGAAYEAWIHQVFDPATWAANRSGHGTNTLALLRPGVSESTAHAELESLQRTWKERYAGQHTFGAEGHSAAVQPVSDRWLGTARRVGWLLSVAAGVLLLLACANVANLLLARGETRAAEAGVRTALGATARRIAQPVIVEGLLLAAAGCAAGLVLATVALPVLMRLAPAEMIGGTGAHIDARTVAFAIAVALSTGVLFSWYPAWSASRQNVSTLLRASGRGRSAGVRGLRILVAAQTALASVLLIGAGLFVRSLNELNAVKPGLDQSGRIALDVVLPAQKYADTSAINAFYGEARRRIEAIGGVEEMTVIQNLPLRNEQRTENVLREGQTELRDAVGLTVQVAGTHVLSTLGIPLVEGRDFDGTDRADGMRVALINQSAARTLWPGESAIGKRVQATFIRGPLGLVTIVGVYGDVRTKTLSSAPSREMMLPFTQSQSWAPRMRNLTIVAKTSGDVSAILPAALATIRGIDAYVPIQSPTTMDDVVRAASSRERFLAALLVVFGLLALAVAATGVVGVVSFTVARQTREIAIRSALGGGRGLILGQVVRANSSVAGAGALVGAAIAAIAAPSVSALLYNVAARDVRLIVLVPISLTIIAALACILPTTKVMRVPLARALGGSE